MRLTSEPTLGAVMTTLSAATDFAMSASAHFDVRSAALAVALARRLGWSEQQAQNAHYQALLRYIGCNVDTQHMAALIGDEMAIRREFAGVDTANKLAVGRLLVRRLREANRQHNPWRAALNIAQALITAEGQMAAMFAGHCEVGQRLAVRIGLNDELVTSLGQLYERWDGKGLPQGLRGEPVAPAALIVSLAQDAIVHLDSGGPAAVRTMLIARRGGAHAPHMVDAFLQHEAALLATLAAVDAGALPEVPGGDEALDDNHLDRICIAMADFADIKSPWTLGHSTAVAQRAVAAAKHLHLDDEETRLLQRAAWLHDIGKVGVSAALWGKPAALTRPEQEQVRLHAYFGERVLSSSPALRSVAELASLTNDRVDGSGYFRRPPQSAISRAARVLAAADVYQALREDRPHRAALDRPRAAHLLREEAGAGHLDVQACEAVLASDGHPARRDPAVNSLTERERDVLCSLARGHSMKQIARALDIAPKTVDHHLQRIYPKVGVRTRAGATLYAMEQGYTASAA